MNDSQLSPGGDAGEPEPSLETTSPTGDPSTLDQGSPAEEGQEPAGAEDAEGLEDEQLLEEEPEEELDPSGQPAAAFTPPTGQPWSFNADGKKFDVPGAVVTDHGVWLPKESLGHLQAHLADRRGLYQREQELQRRVRDLDPAKNQQVLTANALISEFQALLQKSPEEVAKWLDELDVKGPELQLRAELAARDARLKELESTRHSEVTERDVSALHQQLEGAFTGLLQQHLAMPEYAGLDRGTVEEFLRENADKVFVEAQQDIPAAGIRKGDTVADLNYVRAVLGRLAKLAGGAQQRTAAGQHNRAVLDRRPPVPVAGRPAAVPAKPGQPKKYATREDWEADFLAGKV